MVELFCVADVLADNGRLPLTGDVIAAFGKMMSAHRGEVLCTVTTAQVQSIILHVFLLNILYLTDRLK